MNTVQKFGWIACAAIGLSIAGQPANAQKVDPKAPLAPATAPAAAKIDLNAATQADLETLPGVGASTAKKIIAGRPYKTVDDLVKAGVSGVTFDKIKGLVTVKTSVTTAPINKTPVKPLDKTPIKPIDRIPTTGTPAAAVEKPDLNTAPEADLKMIDGIGDAYARKIIAGRPYKTVDDLAKAGVPKATITKIAPHVTVGSVKATTTVDAKTPPVKGMVWVNGETKVYHLEGSHWYGKTVKGEFMTEADAIKAGYKKAKNETATKAP